MNNIKKRAFDLMKVWCDALLKYKIDSDSVYINGALICPVCHVIHGRVADMALPLTTIWAHTGDESYLKAAEKLIDWTETNLRRPGGEYHNDATNTWKAISCFSATSIGDILLKFGDMLPEDIRKKWNAIFIRLSEFCYHYFDTAITNINYIAGAAAELALAWRLTGDKRYLTKADFHESHCRRHFDDNGLLFGEWYPHDVVSKKGCHAIDMGYNLEESLPLLLKYASYSKNSERLEFYKKRFIDHLEFLLPDGAIDNSFGTRHNKWTYWGSRTSDGILSALALLSDTPMLLKASERVLALYERCTTAEGLLAMPMTDSAGELACLHHSFCHAKALAEIVNNGDFSEKNIDESALLPREKEYGIKKFQNGNLLLASFRGWRATFSACDLVKYHGADNGGGSMTLLWHKNVGPICAATMDKYIPSEPLNMQYLRHSDESPCMTPRIECEGKSSVRDDSSVLGAVETKDCITVTAKGSGWIIDYRITENKLEISARAGYEISSKLILSIICSSKTSVSSSRRIFSIGDKIKVSSDRDINSVYEKRMFNQVGGFEYIPLEIPFTGTVKAEIVISD